jgi:hypothetical protein
MRRWVVAGPGPGEGLTSHLNAVVEGCDGNSIRKPVEARAGFRRSGVPGHPYLGGSTMTQPQTPEAPNPFSPPGQLPPPIPAQYTPWSSEPLSAAPGTPTGYGVWPHNWQAAPVGGPVSYWPYPVRPGEPDPDSLLARGMSALHTARVLLWCLVAAHAVTAAGALALMAVADAGSATDIEAAEGLSGLGFLVWFALGTALWVVLAVWCSRTSLAARAAGNQRDSISQMAWWGPFVPLANVVLPFLAYRDAAKYTQAVVRSRTQPRGAGESWRATRLPLGVQAWWALFIASSLCFSAYSAVDPAEDLLEGIFLLATATFGAASGVIGALSFGRLMPRWR